MLSVLLLSGLSGCVLFQDREAMQKRKDGARANVALAIDAMEREQYGEANIKLKKAEELDPKMAQAYWVHGVLDEKVGDYDAARTHFLKALKLDPRDTDALLNYGNFLCRRKEFDEAVTVYERAAKDPYDRAPGEMYTNAGLCLANWGQLERAETFFRRALEKNPKDARALYSMAGLTYATGEFMLTRAFLQRYTEAYGHIAETLKLCVLAEQALGDEAAAGDCQEELLAKYPNSTAAAEIRRQTTP